MPVIHRLMGCRLVIARGFPALQINPASAVPDPPWYLSLISGARSRIRTLAREIDREIVRLLARLSKCNRDIAVGSYSDIKLRLEYTNL
jgi:hypothetical protein